jgi:putative nucleotidyltransferase with HDIG domain
MGEDIRRNILETFPFIEDIRDAELKHKVVDAWVRAMKESSFEAIENIPFSLNVPEARLVDHIHFVLEIARSVAMQAEKTMDMAVDWDLLIALVLLHDVGKAVEYENADGTCDRSEIGRKFGHGLWGAHIALGVGLPLNLAHLISTHTGDSPHPPPLLEGIILHYADFVYADLLYFKSGSTTFLAKNKGRRA